mgnify:CR=1 FL=1
MSRMNNIHNIDVRLQQLDTMLQIRLFEERLDTLFARGELGGTCHLCIGQEAAAVGVVNNLRDGDRVVSSHRGHGHIIAMGGKLERLFGELLERDTGYCGARGGTQHLCAADIGFFGTNGITGGGLPSATGLALAAKRKKSGAVVATFFGDGASNQGTFHESLNMAAVWELPIVYVCENNLYAMSMPISATTKIDDIAIRANGYGMPGIIADGNDIADVDEKAAEAIERARDGGGPTLLEIKTYRHLGHSKSDRRVYRTREEEAAWLEADCISNLISLLRKLGHGDRVDEITEAVKIKIDRAEEIAMNAPFAIDEAGDVYA